MSKEKVFPCDICSSTIDVEEYAKLRLESEPGIYLCQTCVGTVEGIIRGMRYAAIKREDEAAERLKRILQREKEFEERHKKWVNPWEEKT